MGVLWKKPIMDHLVWYKEHVIKCREMGEWDHQPYGHIFPPDKTDLNFFDGKPPISRWLKKEADSEKEETEIKRVAGYDHMNSHWVMGLNLFPHLFDSPAAERALLDSLRAQGLSFLMGRTIREAWFEEPLQSGVMADVCMRLDDGKRILIQLYYYQFCFGGEVQQLFAESREETYCVFVLLKQNTALNPDYNLEAEIDGQENREMLHVIYWERWIPCLIHLLSGNSREYYKEFYRKSLDF